MRYAAAVLSFVLLFAMAGCQGKYTRPDVPPSAGTYRKNITYAGAIPCAECRLQKLTVTLFDDGTFRLKRVSVGVRGGGNKVEYNLGRWNRKSGRLVLNNGEKWPLQFRYISGNEIPLRLVGSEMCIRDSCMSLHQNRYQMSLLIYEMSSQNLKTSNQKQRKKMFFQRLNQL